MKREHLTFLFGGLAFGILVGYGFFHALENRPLQDGAPVAASAMPGPRGPMAPTDVGGGASVSGAAPMLALINDLKRQLEADPRSYDLSIQLAEIYDRVEMRDQALMLYERAADARPESAEIAAHVANRHHDAGHWERAAHYYERALETASGDADLLTDLGTCYRGMQRFDQALETFDRAHALDPAHWQSLYNKVVVAAFDLRRFDLALATIAALEALVPRPADLGDERLQQLRQAVESEASAAAAGERRS